MTSRLVVLDTETTGLEVKDGHRIIEIGAIEIVGRKITERRFHQYVNPERECDEGRASAGDVRPPHRMTCPARVGDAMADP